MKEEHIRKMFKMKLKVLSAYLFLLALPCVYAAAELPRTAQGTFVQRKVLADVDVTLVSRGRFRFARDRFFEWETREPVPSTFYATPTNYAVTVAGRTSTHALNVDVTDVAKIFEIKEMREFVQSVETTPKEGFPDRVKVVFKNGDRLEIELTRTP